MHAAKKVAYEQGTASRPNKSNRGSKPGAHAGGGSSRSSAGCGNARTRMRHREQHVDMCDASKHTDVQATQGPKAGQPQSAQEPSPQVQVRPQLPQDGASVSGKVRSILPRGSCLPRGSISIAQMRGKGAARKHPQWRRVELATKYGQGLPATKKAPERINNSIPSRMLKHSALPQSMKDKLAETRAWAEQRSDDIGDLIVEKAAWFIIPPDTPFKVKISIASTSCPPASSPSFPCACTSRPSPFL